MGFCFVIQPFDGGGQFDKRYKDVYGPAIEDAGLDAYRVDNDPSAKILIEDIEKNIKNSDLCLADISVDNPNVWYELGFAFASGKEVVLIASKDRGKFPFDIQHRSVITYETGSLSDFQELKSSITERINAYRESAKTVEKLYSSPVLQTEGLAAHEVALLAFIIGNQFILEESVSVWELKNEMNRAGYNDVAVSLGIRTLVNKGFVVTDMDQDYNGSSYPVCKLTKKGEDWIMSNQKELDLKVSKTSSQTLHPDDLPF